MAVGFNLVVDEHAELVRQGLQDLAADIPKIGRQGIYRTVQRILARMRKAGAGVQYPINWDSDRQRRAFFASDGFGRGIPTVRTGAHQQGWQIQDIMPEGYMVVNRIAGAEFVYSNYDPLQEQSRIHEDRWPRLLTVVPEEVVRLPDDIRAEMRVTAAGHWIEVTGES